MEIVERPYEAGQGGIEFDQSDKREQQRQATTGQRQVREETARPLLTRCHHHGIQSARKTLNSPEWPQAVGYPHQPLAIRRKHRKAVEMTDDVIRSSPFPSSLIRKRWKTRAPALLSILFVGGKDDPLSVWMKER